LSFRQFSFLDLPAIIGYLLSRTETEDKEVTLMPSQQPLEHSSNKNPLMPFIAGGLGYLVKYISYGFLTPVILLSFSALVFGYIAFFGPELPFLRYFASVLPINSDGTTHLNTDDIMLGYGSITTALFLLSITGSGLMSILRRFKKQSSPSDPLEGTDNLEAPSAQAAFLKPVKRRLIISSIVIALIFASSLIAIPFAPLAVGESKASWYVILIILCVIALISNAIYTVIDSLSDKMFGWTGSNIN
jgi:hypothetical protein